MIDRLYSVILTTLLYYEVNRALHDYMLPSFDAGRERTVAYGSVSTSEVETNGIMWCQSASSIVLGVDRCLSSSAIVSI